MSVDFVPLFSSVSVSVRAPGVWAPPLAAVMAAITAAAAAGVAMRTAMRRDMRTPFRGRVGVAVRTFGANRPSVIVASSESSLARVTLVWFTDPGTTKAIGRITPTGTITELSTGAGTSPREIAPGPDANLWFTDNGTPKSIGKITPTGTISQSNFGLNPGGVPTGIARGSDGNL
jgi:streptogramin lyase